MNKYSIRDKLTLFLLTAGVFCFGVILPDSLSDHDKLVHFSAHFGMSFLLGLCSYMICTVKLRISKRFSYTILIAATLIIGVLYKYWEIATQGIFERFSFSTAMELTGTMTSMSQNISGILGAMLLIEALVHRNLIMQVLKSGKLSLGPTAIHSPQLDNRPTGIRHGHLQGGSMPLGSQFSPEPLET